MGNRLSQMPHDRFKLISLYLSMAFFMLIGCAGKDFSKVTYKSLAITGMTYNAIIKSAIDLHQQQIISDENFEAIKNVARKFRLAYNACVDALAIYELSKTENNKKLVDNAILIFNQSLIDVLAIAKEYGVNYE